MENYKQFTLFASPAHLMNFYVSSILNGHKLGLFLKNYLFT